MKQILILILAAIIPGMTLAQSSYTVISNANVVDARSEAIAMYDVKDGKIIRVTFKE